MDKVLVLNSDYSPMNVTSVCRGFILVNKGKAEILKSGDNPIKTGMTEYVRPLIIRLLNYVKYRSQKLRINRPRVYRRDKYECVYCGSKKNLKIDHILPKSKGGQNTWMNLITCCSPCNRYKGDRTPEEANMLMRFKPYEPSIFSEIINPTVEEVWNNYKESMLL